MSTSRAKLYGGIVYVLKLEKAELIDGSICQECSLRYARNSRLESWPVDIFVLSEKTRFLRNIHTMSTSLTM